MCILLESQFNNFNIEPYILYMSTQIVVSMHKRAVVNYYIVHNRVITRRVAIKGGNKKGNHVRTSSSSGWLSRISSSRARKDRFCNLQSW